MEIYICKNDIELLAEAEGPDICLHSGLLKNLDDANYPGNYITFYSEKHVHDLKEEIEELKKIVESGNVRVQYCCGWGSCSGP